MLESLDGKEDSWYNQTKELEKLYAVLVGNALLYAAFITYLGRHPLATRSNILRNWYESNKKIGLPGMYFFANMIDSFLVSEDFSAEQFLPSVQLSEWIRLGLSSDQQSKQNAVIITTSNKWCFIIDPGSEISAMNPSSHVIYRTTSSEVDKELRESQSSESIRS
jgi:hypothetical protein